LTSDAGGGATAGGASGPPRAGAARTGLADQAFDRRVPAVVFALLVAACFVAFFLTQRLKHTPTAVQLFKLTPFFSPTPNGHIKAERISFRIAEDDEVTVTVVDPTGARVATLLRDHPVQRYKQLSLRWSGRRGNAHGYTLVAGPNGAAALVPRLRGRLAPAGEYRVRVTLRREQRWVLSPRSFTLVRP
jgi:hypothetical protein